MPPLRPSLFLILGAGLAQAADPAGLPRSSPFLPATAAGTAPAATTENVEFAGISTVGKRTDLILHDKTTKKNHWIARGETKEGISVLNYDEQRQQVVVKINGTEKTLALRKAASPRASGGAVLPPPAGFNVPTAPVAAPAVEPAAVAAGPVTNVPPASAPSAPASPASPEATRIKQETEARMLVSDLLEIGMAQRKAYEEAQRKAASGDTSSPAPPPAAPQ